MRNIKGMMLICLATLLTSCFQSGNYGYPGKISFGKEGGIRSITGDEQPYDLEITDYDGNGKNDDMEENAPLDSFKVTYKWLTARAKKGESKIDIIAEPNNTGRSRTLYVSGMIDDSFFETKVTQ